MPLFYMRHGGTQKCFAAEFRAAVPACPVRYQALGCIATSACHESQETVMTSLSFSHLRKTSILVVGLVLCLVSSVFAQNGPFNLMISKTLGGGGTGFAEGVPAQSVAITPYGIATDGYGNVYVGNGTAILKIDRLMRTISTVAGAPGGSAPAGYVDGAASSAMFTNITALATDAAGNVYIADAGNNAIRELNVEANTVCTIAGNSSGTIACGASVIPMPAVTYYPVAITVNAAGNLIYFADNNSNIYEIVSTGITQVAGTGVAGYGGDGGSANLATLNNPLGLVLDNGGNLFIADSGNNLIREITTGGNMVLVAGLVSGGVPQSGYSGDNGNAVGAALNDPTGIMFQSINGVQDLLFVDTGNSVVRYIQNGQISTLAPLTGLTVYGVASLINGGVGVDTAHNVVIELGSFLDSGAAYVSLAPGAPSPTSTTFTAQLPLQQAMTISKIAIPSAPSSKYSGLPSSSNYSSVGFSVGPITGCTIDGKTTNPAGTTCSIPITFTPPKPGNRRAPLVVTYNTGTGTQMESWGITGYGMSPSLGSPASVSQFANFSQAPANLGGSSSGVSLTGATYDTASNFYVTTGGNHTVWVYNSSNSEYALVAGQSGVAGSGGDGGPATSALLNNPSGVAEDPAGNIYIADTDNCRIRMISINGAINTVVGNGTCSSTGDGGSASSASTAYPKAIVAGGATSHVYFAEDTRVRVFDLNGTGIISTYAGGGSSTSDNIPATQASLAGITSVLVDRFGDLYIALGPTGGSQVRKVDSHGYITTVPTGTLINPVGVATDQAGFLYISDAGNSDVLRVDLSGNVSVVAGIAGSPGSGCGSPGIWSTNTSLGPVGQLVNDASGDVMFLNTNPTSNYVCEITFGLGSRTYNFPHTAAGQSTTLHEYLYNNGNLGITLSTFTFSGSSAFSQTAAPNPCSAGTKLPVGSSCNLYVQFTAPAAQTSAYTGALTLTDGSYSSPQTINLSGISVGSPSQLILQNVPTSIAAGGSLTGVTVSIEDADNNTVGPYPVTVSVYGPAPSGGGTGPLVVSPTFTVNGTVTIQPIPPTGIDTVGTYTIQAVCASCGTSGLTSNSPTFTVTANTSGPAHIQVVAPSTATVGQSFSFTVTAEDLYGNTLSGYSGTVHFTSSDPLAVLPANSTLLSGTGTFNATLNTQGSQTITATDTTSSTINGTSGMLTVNQAAPSTWIQLNPNPDPVYGSPTIACNTQVYSPATNRMILFGGATDAGCYDLVNDVWVLTNADGTGGTPAWTKLAPLTTNGAPSPRTRATAAYDQTNNRMIVQGGYTAPGSCGGSVGDTWVLTNADGSGGGSPTWIPLSTTGPAPVKQASQSAYDAADNLLIVSGGQDGGCGTQTDTTWVLSNANGLGAAAPVWTLLSPASAWPSSFSWNFICLSSPCFTANDPQYMILSAGYNSASNSLVAFTQTYSGQSQPNPLTWADRVRVLSGANGNGSPAWTDVWVRLSSDVTPGSPAYTQYPAAVYDATRDSMVLFGGYVTGLVNNVWKLAYASGQGGTPHWTQLQPAGTAPSPRYQSASVYNPQSDRMVVYGGWGGSGPLYDVWVMTSAMALNPILTPAATPTFYPLPGTYVAGPNGLQYVALSSTTPGNTIYYTLDGSTPTTASLTQLPITLLPGTTTTINAIAVAPGYSQSATATGTYTITGLPALTSVIVTPTSSTIAYGGSQQFTATGQYSDNSTQNLTTTATWTSSNTGIATIGATGLASAVAAGSTTISASFNGMTSNPVTLTVNQATPSTWIQLNPNPDLNYGTPTIACNTQVYSPVTNRMILFGGATDAGCYALVNDVWVLTNADGTGGTPAWTKLIPRTPNGAPSPRMLATAAYDQANNRMIVQGGYTTPGSCGGSVSDTWVLTNADASGGSSPTWIPLSTTGTAPLRRASQSAYDAADNILIVSGGMNGGCGNETDETWVLTNANGLGTGTPVWTELNPGSAFPSGTNYAISSAGYNPSSNILVSFSQTYSSGWTDWVRALSNANGLGSAPAWANVGGSGSLPVTIFPAAVYDATRNGMVIFGGVNANGSLVNNAWKLAYASGQGGTPQWTQLQPAGTAPSPRQQSASVYNPQSDRMIVYGGYASGYLYDVWVLTSAMAQQQNPTMVSTTTSLNASPSSAILGQQVTLTATVTWAQSNGSTPSGTVNFFNGGIQLGSSGLVQVSSTTAQASLTINASQLALGSNNLQASYSGDSTFLASNGTTSVTVAAYGTAATLSIVSGTPQTVVTGSTFAAPLVATVLDQYGDPVPNVIVTFTAPASGASASLSASSAITQSNGQAFVTATANAIPGAYNVTASVTGLGSGIFALTNVTGSSQSFSSVAVGSNVSTTLWYSFTNLSTTPNFALAYGLEFTAGVPSCSGTGTLVCSVAVTFAPKYAGLRQDAMVVTDGSGNVLQTTLLSGVGQAPEAVVVPGVIITVAGNGTASYGGDGGAATSAELWAPAEVAVDVAANQYIADRFNKRIRKVNAATGVITTVAGGGSGCTGQIDSIGDGCLATAVELGDPTGVAVDAAGNVYIADVGYTRIRKVSAATGVITTVAGGGSGCTGQTDSIGDGCAATSASLASPQNVAVDAAGNLYIADANNYRVRKVDATTGVITTVAGNGTAGYSGDGGAATGAELNVTTDVAVDVAGNLYIADFVNSRIRKVDATMGVITTVAGNGSQGDSGDGGAATSAGLSNPAGVAVDSAGNLYIAENGNRVRKVTAATGVITTVAGGGNGCAGQTDSVGDGCAATSANIYGPSGVAVDAAGNLDITDNGNNRVRQVSATSALLIFPQTNVGSVSPTQTVTVSNIGTSTLSFGGFTASANFAIDASATTCSTSSPLVAGNSCTVGVMFTPSASGSLNGTLTITDNSLNASGATQQVQLSGTGLNTSIINLYLSQNGSNPIPYGTNLWLTMSVNQAGSLVPTGTFTYQIDGGTGQTVPLTNGAYTLQLGSGLSVGSHQVSVTYSGDANYSPQTNPQLQPITINQATPTVSFTGAPASAGYHSTFTVSATTNASTTAVITGTGACSVTGTTVTMTSGTGTCSLSANWAADANYSAASLSQSTTATTIAPAVSFTGAPASAGYHSTFTVSATTNASTTAVITASGACTIAGTTVTITASTGTCSLIAAWAADNNYLAASATQSTIATKATPTITWATPGAITYGTALRRAQLDAKATYNGAEVAGRFAYTPERGTVLDAGTHTLSVVFTPRNTVDYTTASASVTLQVNPATPKITWAKPAAITYGTALSSTQLNATASVPGSFAYSPAAGTVLPGGAQTLSVSFTPNDTTDYTTATDTVTITVNEATPTVTWLAPSSITYGTALSGTQLNATASVPGSFVYSPAAGTVLDGGSHTLSVTFTPTDATDYATAKTSVTLQVNPVTPTITWATPAAITYGTALNGTQLNAKATYNGVAVGGSFTYTPDKGAVLGAGTQILSVVFTPNNTTDYTTAGASVTLQVNPATPKITWAKPAAITYGTALSSTQLNATASVPGLFVYTPAAGTVLPAGAQTLAVTFTPSDTTDYTTATDTVTITVNQARSTTTITSDTPNPSQVGEAVTVSFSVMGTGVPTGSVVVTASTGESCTGTLSAGAGSCLLTFTASGSRTLTASYAGDNNFKSSSSDKVKQVVQP
jgi:hypothetical protein